ncbi:MAG: signal peptidase I [Eubacterium sp.]|nr:signal peptidase I [Eubacterium sp.]
MEEKETTKENTENLQGVGPEEVTENSDAEAKTEAKDSGTEREEKTEDSDSKSEEESEESDGKKHKKERKKKSTIHRIINVVEWLLLLASVTLLAYIFITTMQGKAADFFGYRILHVVTGSMEPTISVDDYIVVQDVNPEDLEKDDIIAFYTEDQEIKGKMVIHRIVDILADGSFVMKGDANPVADPLTVRGDQVVGKYKGRLRFLNWISSFVSVKKLLLLAVIIPMFLMSIYEVSTLARLFKKGGKAGKKKGKARSKKKEGEGADASTTGETKEEKIERLKREAVEEYLKAHGQGTAVETEDKEIEGEKTEDIETEDTETEDTETEDTETEDTETKDTETKESE